MTTPPSHKRQSTDQELDEQRYELLDQIEEWLEGPGIVLGFIWQVLNYPNRDPMI